MPNIQGYKAIITPAIQAKTNTTDHSVKHLLKAAEALANIRAILLAHDADTPLSREEFVSTNFLVQLATNNLQAIPRGLVDTLEPSTYTTTRGKHKTNFNLLRNSTAHVLNLEYFIS